MSGPFVAPDGSRGTASWLVACDPCYQAVGNDLKRIDEIEVRNHVIWNGDAPVIVENYS